MYNVSACQTPIWFSCRTCTCPYNPCVRTLSNASNTKNLTQQQRDQIISECVDEQISPMELGKKWGCSPDTIRHWVKKAGKTLPKTYKKTEYSDSRSSTPG